MKKTSSIISTDPASAEGEDSAALEPQEEVRSFAVGPAQHGERLDKCLVEATPEFSRSYLQQLVEDGAVLVDGVPVRKAALRLKIGSAVAVALRATPQSRAFKAQEMPLQLVHEDRHLIVLDKPAGLVVHPAPGNWSGTLLNGLLAYDPALADLPRAGIVHRLDKDTSGLMVVARTRLAMDALVRMIAARTVQRQYLALAHRAWSGPAVRDVTAAIGRDPRNRLRMAVVDIDRHAGKEARTTLEMLASSDSGCLVRCTLHTGRTHQIRVHMASIGHPLVADTTYGGDAAAGMQRQALHAFRLALSHPVTHDALDWRSQLPEDLQSALEQWGFASGLSYNPT